ncbi:MAG: enoyl-CoA hydratase/isomerase family protein [Deltaproteobacteria bacterium]|nr:enoyl-CoA hydratase/isomerase family protein [Deltaproteobacteria bacterium]
MTYETLIVERSGHVGTITINRPKALNALNSMVLKELARAIHELTDVDAVRALILTGAGDRAFVAGADIAEMAPMGPWQAREFSELGHVAFALLEDLPCATIAAINGFALGGGLELALSCDLLYASEKAKLGQPEVNLAVTPGFGGSQRLVRLVGKTRAKELIFTGDFVDAQKAKEIGLVLEVMKPEELMPHCQKVAEKIASKGPLAIAKSKRLVERGYDMPLRAANRQEAETFALLFDTHDRREGMAAFLEKRPPVYTGK